MSKKNHKQTQRLQKIQKTQQASKKQLLNLQQTPDNLYVRRLDRLRLDDALEVGYKNASLGELIYLFENLNNNLENNLENNLKPPKVATGFALSNHAFSLFLQHNQLDNWIKKLLSQINVDDLETLKVVAAKIQEKIIQSPLPKILEDAIQAAFEDLSQNIMHQQQVLEQQSLQIVLQNMQFQTASQQPLIFAVRSSASTEDLKQVTNAGQQSSFLNVQGFENILLYIKKVFASLYEPRAIAYRWHKNINEVQLSVTVQQMVRSDLASSGVIFTLDTESGFQDLVVLSASYGLGEAITQGLVTPDEFYVFKPTLLYKPDAQSILKKKLGSKLCKLQLADAYMSSNIFGDLLKMVEVSEKERLQFSISEDDVKKLAYYACLIEKHYGYAVDIEWAKDAYTQELYILQARPETVKTQELARKKQGMSIERYQFSPPAEPALCQGRAIGQKIGTGVVRIVHDLEQANALQKGEILVTDYTDASWEPYIQKASAVVTNRGGRTSHAAIIARELGIPAVVACENATQVLKNRQLITVSCAQGDDGFIYDGLIDFNVKAQLYQSAIEETPFNLMMNIDDPQLAFEYAQLPNHGAGLVQIEYIMNQLIGVHPNAILAYPNMDEDLKKAIHRVAAGYKTPEDFYIQQLKSGIACIAAAFYPKPAIVRFCDFNSIDYRKLMGGARYEPIEANPMLGLRGVSRYLSPEFSKAFELECIAVYQAITEMGFDNIQLMLPYVRTLAQAKEIVTRLENYGFRELGVKIIMMCELPINALLAEDFLAYFDGLAIGTNDLTQLTLGLDYDSGLHSIKQDFDEQNQAVKMLMTQAIAACRKHDKYIGVCGRALSKDDGLVKWLIEQEVDSISFNADSIMQAWQNLK